MFDQSVSKRARAKEVERAAQQLADSVSKLLDMSEGDDRHDSRHDDCDHCESKYKMKKEAWKQEARRKWDNSRRMAGERSRQIDQYAHENVWKTVGMAAAVGAILGSMLMKRKR